MKILIIIIAFLGSLFFIIPWGVWIYLDISEFIRRVKRKIKE